MPSSACRYRVLVVDDDQGVRGFLKAVLSGAGHIVDEARDGDEALDRLGRESYAIVVTDLEMPRKGGLDVLRGLRALGQATPLLLVTGSLTDEVVAECGRHGAVGWLSKPFTPTQLVQAFDAVARGHLGNDSSEPRTMED